MALIAGVVALAAIGVAGVVILSQGLTQGARMIIVNAMITGILGLAASLLTLQKVEKVHDELKNGLIPEKVKEAVTEMAEDPNSPAITIGHDD